MRPNDQPKPSKSASATMSFGEHLEDLRRRLILALIGIAPIFIGALLLGKSALALLIHPARHALRQAGLPDALQTTGVVEIFSSYMRISVIATVAFGSPWILWQLWKFVAPGLYEHEKRFARILLPLSTALTLSAAAFMYYVMLPVVLAFFINFGTQIAAPDPDTQPLPPGIVLPNLPALEHDPIDAPAGSIWLNLPQKRFRVMLPGGAIYSIPLTKDATIVPQYRVSEYINLVLALALAFAVGFQMPVVVLLLGWVGIVDLPMLRHKRRHAILFTAIAAAVLTPADPLSMFLLWAPLYALFELGMVLLKAFPPDRVAQADTQAGEPPDAGDP